MALDACRDLAHLSLNNVVARLGQRAMERAELFAPTIILPLDFLDFGANAFGATIRRALTKPLEIVFASELRVSVPGRRTCARAAPCHRLWAEQSHRQHLSRR
jgi:hypothetical protein